jgi:hypothetical protein
VQRLARSTFVKISASDSPASFVRALRPGPPASQNFSRRIFRAVSDTNTHAARTRTHARSLGE